MLALELHDMSIRLEESMDFTEEDQFLSAVFEGGFDGLDEVNQWDSYRVTLAKFSRDFPD